jgi:hypothetical protein
MSAAAMWVVGRVGGVAAAPSGLGAGGWGWAHAPRAHVAPPGAPRMVRARCHGATGAAPQPVGAGLGLAPPGRGVATSTLAQQAGQCSPPPSPPGPCPPTRAHRGPLPLHSLLMGWNEEIRGDEIFQFQLPSKAYERSLSESNPWQRSGSVAQCHSSPCDRFAPNSRQAGVQIVIQFGFYSRYYSASLQWRQMVSKERLWRALTRRIWTHHWLWVD